MTADNDDVTNATGSNANAGHIPNLDVTVGIVTAYIANNSLRASELPDLIIQVHAAVSATSVPPASATKQTALVEAAKPAAIRKSITPDALISFIDGKPYKILRRHLTAHGLDIDSYRARYGLPADYPMISASYSATRAALAKQLGLGKRIGKKDGK